MTTGFEIIPVLPVNEPCFWCEPQSCYEASVWWGEVLLLFYSTDQSRLAPEPLNQEACAILKLLTEAITPERDDVIDPVSLRKAMNNTILCCFWEDFRPAVAMAYKNKCVIPVSVVEGTSP